MDIETILQKMGYRKIFKKDGTLTVNGTKAYGKILDIVCNLTDAGIISKEASDKFVESLDKAIDNFTC